MLHSLLAVELEHRMVGHDSHFEPQALDTWNINHDIDLTEIKN